jgi:peroxiredoxin
VAQVVSHHAEIQTLHTNVVTVSFGAPYWAQVWLQETQSPFPFLVDSERAAYHAYGMESSFIRSWSPSAMWYHVKAVLQNRETFGKRGDPHQLGGDFIVDRRGIIQMAHPSREPTDRPSVEKILTTLQEVNESKES